VQILFRSQMSEDRGISHMIDRDYSDHRQKEGKRGQRMMGGRLFKTL